MADSVSISSTTAWLLSAFFATSYVASLYVLPGGRLVFLAQQVEVGPNADRARLENEKWRSDPSTIKARLTGVSLATLSSLLIVYVVVTQAGSWNVSSQLKLGSDLIDMAILVGRYGSNSPDFARLRLLRV